MCTVTAHQVLGRKTHHFLLTALLFGETDEDNASLFKPPWLLLEQLSVMETSAHHFIPSPFSLVGAGVWLAAIFIHSEAKFCQGIA